jgi:hypothetical protein
MSNWEVFRACAFALGKSIEGQTVKIIRVPSKTLIPGADPKELKAKFGIEDE